MAKHKIYLYNQVKYQFASFSCIQILHSKQPSSSYFFVFHFCFITNTTVSFRSYIFYSFVPNNAKACTTLGSSVIFANNVACSLSKKCVIKKKKLLLKEDKIKKCYASVRMV
jgi:hypothetical protein